MNELSKYLCLLLRHQPEKAGLDMDEHGWVSRSIKKTDERTIQLR